jgi:hypothetical protein
VTTGIGNSAVGPVTQKDTKSILRQNIKHAVDPAYDDASNYMHSSQG